MAKRAKALKNITRVRNMAGRPNEYWVRVFRFGKKICDKHFYDSHYESAKLAREAACAFRDEILQDNPKMTRQEFAQRKMRNNKSGIVGVQELKRDGQFEVVAYRARWIPKKGGKRVSATFTVAEHGRKARKMAVEARENGVFGMQN